MNSRIIHRRRNIYRDEGRAGARHQLDKTSTGKESRYELLVNYIPRDLYTIVRRLLELATE
jgi:hypothetical protein